MENVKNIQELSIDDGSRCYRIKNLYGKELGIVVINPADINISKRYEEVFASFENLASGLDGHNNSEKVDMAERAIKEKLDYLLGDGVSEQFFKILSPFTPLASGAFYVESVINAIAAVIEKEMDVRLKKVTARVQKYTKK